MRLGLMLALMLTVGCATDADGDGVNAKNDCNDNDDSVTTAASETCDGIDNDCDGEIDEDVTDTFYLDNDGDGYGYATVTIEACDEPTGYTDNGEDCDDQNDDTYPGADELCDEDDNDCDGSIDEDATTLYYADSDGDGYGSDIYTSDDCTIPSGYAAVGGDCDDENAKINPDAEEVCDGVDNDCEGDEDGDDDQAVDATTWYYDADADSYGLSDKTINACEQPGNYAAVDGDCDDTDKAINPSAVELCDEGDVDDDCDGYADDADVDIFGQDPAKPDIKVSGASVWYGDADSDGYGGWAFSIVACDAPSNYVDNGDDCDDLDEDINPDATEICDDRDNDCDDDTDDDDNSVVYIDENDEDVLWYIDVDGDGYGSERFTIEQCDQPSNYVASDDSSLDCDDQDDAINPGVEEECNDGVDNNCDDSPSPCTLVEDIAHSDADYKIVGDVGLDSSDNGDKVGSSLAIGDVNNDGHDDLLVGAIGVNGSNTDDGGLFLFYGPIDDASQEASSDADAVFLGGDDADNAGYAVTAVDLDGDNYDDIVVTSYGEDLLDVADTGTLETDNAGVVYVMYGSATEFSGSQVLSDAADATFVGASEDEHFGCALTNAGDMDGDDREELVLGNCIDNDTGASFLLYGSTTRFDGEYVFEDEVILAAEGDGYAAWYGDSSNSYTGTTVSSIHDFDGDGLMDMAFGAHGHDPVSGSTTVADAGAAFVIYGDGTQHYGVNEVETANAYFNGENAYDNAGHAVSGLGDIDGDGYADFAVGAPGYDRDLSSTSSGITYIIFGGSSKSGELSTTTHVLGETQYDLLGEGLADVGDIDDDNYADVVVGAPDEGGNYGAAYLFYGPISGELEASDADAKFSGNSAGTGEFGLTFANSGDVDGDGELDVVIGAGVDDFDGESDNTDLGAVYIFAGGGL